jgi:hypothetical protein
VFNHTGGIEMQDKLSSLKGIMLASALNAMLWTIIIGTIIAIGY